MAARKSEDQRRKATSKNSVGRTSAQAAKKTAARKERALSRSSARSAGRTRGDVAVPGKVTEAGVGNIPLTIARGAAAIAKAVSRSSSKPAPKTSSKPAAAPKYRDFAAEAQANRAYTERMVRQQTGAAAERTSKTVRSMKEAERIKKNAPRRSKGSGTPGGYRRGF